MLRIKLNSPLIALLATCGIAAGAAVGQSALAADPIERGDWGGGRGGGGFHGPSGPGGGHPGGGGGHSPAPGGHGPAPGYHPPAPTPGGHGGYHPPAPTPGGHGGYHPPAPTPGGHGGYHPPAPTPGGHGGYHPPAPTPGGHGGYHPPAPTPGGHGGYPGGHPGNSHGGYPVGHAHGPGYSYGHDHYGNIVSPVYHDRIDLGRRRMDDMRNDARVRGWVDQRGVEFRNHEHQELIRYNDRYVRYHDDYRERYRPWWNEGFYGGCYWSFHPYYDIDTYFYNPVVYWFYGTDGDDYFYRTWYGPEFDRYPEFRARYRYARAFYPTEEFRDLNLGVSALSVDTQAKYLRASTILGDRLALELKNRGGDGLDENAVVVDHYQILPEDQGVVVEGFVDQGDVQFAFKAVQDLSNPDRTSVFAAAADEDVSSDSIEQLRQLNTRIEDLGGVAEGEEGTDGTVTAPSNGDQNSGDGQPSDWDDQNGSG